MWRHTQPRHLRRAAGAVGLVLAATGFAQTAGPTLTVDAAPGLAPEANRIRSLQPDRFVRVMQLAGLADPGGPIHVRLIAEGSLVAKATPPWVAGYADAARDLVVLFPRRVGSYPYESLESVLQHEVTHILVARAAGGRPVPRWFNEGLATAAERGWVLEDRSRFAWELLRRGRVPIGDLDELFAGGRRDGVRAYSVSRAFVRHLLDTHGPSAPGRILAQVSRGQRFEMAFEAGTGVPLASAYEAFWRDHQVWERWLTLLTRPFTLWMFVTLLAVAAIVKHRRKRAARRRRWDEEELALHDTSRDAGPRYDVH